MSLLTKLPMLGTRGTGRCTARRSIAGGALYQPSVSISFCVARTALGEPSTGSSTLSIAVPVGTSGTGIVADQELCCRAGSQSRWPRVRRISRRGSGRVQEHSRTYRWLEAVAEGGPAGDCTRGANEGEVDRPARV